MSKRTYVPAEIRRHWARVAALDCIITGAPATIAHCHGGSIVERMQEPKAHGLKLRRMHWLVLPLAPELALPQHDTGIDLDVRAWEAENGTQASYIDQLCEIFKIDLWAKAKEGRK